MISVSGVIGNWYLGRPLKHKGVKLGRLDQYFDTLFKRGYHGGFVVIETGKNAFVQFAKDISATGDISIYSHFFSGSWADPHLATIESILSSLNIEYSWPNNEGEKSLEINFHKDLALCKAFVIEINRQVLGLSEDEMEFNIWFKGVSAEDRLIKNRHETK